MIIDLAFSIVSLGSVKSGSNEEMASHLVKFFKEQKLNPKYQDKTDIETIVKECMIPHNGAWGLDYWFTCPLYLNWNTAPKDLFAEAQIYFFTDSRQYGVRLNFIPPDWVSKRTDYDSFAQEFGELAIEIHKKCEDVVTIVDRNSTRLGSGPYNLETLPMWIGWYSVYNQKIADKYKLKDLANTQYVDIHKDDSGYIIRSTKPWSEYKRYGWDDASKSFLTSSGGRLLKK